MGRVDRIIPVIVAGDYSSERDLFPAYLREYFEHNPTKELLGINIGKVGKDKALIRIVSRMLDVSFDSLWKRHQRQTRIKALACSAVSAIALLSGYLFAIPVTLHVSVYPQSSRLPTHGDIILNLDGGEYVSTVENPKFEDIRLPGYKRFSHINLIAGAQFFVGVDTTLPVGFGLRRDIQLNLMRDNTFAIFKGTVYDDDMKPLSGVDVSVAGHSDKTTPAGTFSIILPLDLQRIDQTISITKEGYKKIERDDETPGNDLRFIMHKI